RTDDRGIAGEARLPQTIAQHYDTRRLLSTQEVATEGGPHVASLKEAWRDARPKDTGGLAVGERVRLAVEGARRLEDPRLLAPVVEVACRRATPSALETLQEHHHPVSVGVGKGLQQ